MNRHLFADEFKGFKPCQVTDTDVYFFGMLVSGRSLKGHSCPPSVINSEMTVCYINGSVFKMYLESGAMSCCCMFFCGQKWYHV